MARIRSVHPGIYTDEAWASVSIEARWLAVALMTEADDNGIFQWKPLQIKMRIFPADNIDVGDLLSELHEAEIILQFEESGKQYGAVRNFCKYQKPRKPKTVYPLPDRIREIVSAKSAEVNDDEGSSVPQKSELDDVEECSVPQKSENPPQREEGGGMMEDGREEENKKPRRERALIIETLCKVVTEDRAKALIAHRRNKKSPITPHIAVLIVQSLSKAQNPNAAADEWLERGWQAWKPDWSDLPKVNGSTGPPQVESQAKLMRRQLEEEAQGGQPDRDHPTPH